MTKLKVRVKNIAALWKFHDSYFASASSVYVTRLALSKEQYLFNVVIHSLRP
jgi:hypothetical protein